MTCLRVLASVSLRVVVMLGIFAIPAGALIGADSPFDGAPIPMSELQSRRAVGKAVMFTGAGAAALAAFGAYAVDRVGRRRA